MSKLRVLISDTHEPYFNLATEEWIFRNLDLNTHTLFLWRNTDSVFIGRSQNPWLECNTRKLDDDGVMLARRSSGGGTVYHDLGNTNFTFLCAKDSYDKQNNIKIISAALAHFDIQAYASGRSDMVIDHSDGHADISPRKISGSAFRETRDRAYHHGTMLINADLTRLYDYLSPLKKQLITKGVKSNRSTVINLQEINPDISHVKFCDALINAFFNYHNASCEVETLSHESLQQIPELMQNHELYQDWHWRFGKTMDFEHHLQHEFAWGEVNIVLKIHKGHINSICIDADNIPATLNQSLPEILTDVRYEKSALENILRQHNLHVEHLPEIITWLSSEIA